MPESDLVKTGIKGLDEILFGGIPRGNIILVAGTAGTGKTTLGVEFVYRGARQFNEPGVIVLFEVAPDKLIRDAALFGWDLRELERDGRLKMVFTTRQVFQQELLQADSVLLAEAAEIGARRMVNGQGIEGCRRVQARRSLRREGSAAFDTTSRVATGIPGLDELVNGGYFVGSTTLVVGISGAGKSVMALQFIAEGARRG